MPGAKVFLDSNVLLYSRDSTLSAKAEAASEWLTECVARDMAHINLQVLNEVTHVMLRKRQDMTAEQVFTSVDELRFLGVTPTSETTIGTARSLRLVTRYSWWDCLLLASAINLGCTHFLSEDLQDGQVIEGLTIVSPFAHSPEQILTSS